MEQTNKPTSLNISGAIIIAGAIIALAIIFTKVGPINNNPQKNQNTENNLVFTPVSSDDRIYGNPEATVFVVEYSDPSCPFCKFFHGTMVKLMNEFAKDGKVAWVYRHYPLDTPNSYGVILHPKARKEAHAFECAWDQGGNAKFFEFAEKFYAETPSVTRDFPNGFEESKYPALVKSVGLDIDKFNTCMESGKFNKRISEQFQSGVKAGVAGTPFSFIITKSGRNVPINGAQPYDVVKNVITKLIDEEKNSN